MELKNNFSLLETSSDGMFFEQTLENEKRGNRNISLRANVFLSFAVLGTMSLTQVNATTHFNFQNLEEVQKSSLKCTEEIISELSNYSDKLNRSSFFDKSQLIESILSFKSLENSWDGYNAIPAGVKCAVNAIQIVNSFDTNSLEKISDIFPNPNGTINFEWENSYDEIVSLEIGKSTFSYFVALNSLETKFYNKQSVTFENIKILKEFISAI